MTVQSRPETVLPLPTKAFANSIPELIILRKASERSNSRLTRSKPDCPPATGSQTHARELGAALRPDGFSLHCIALELAAFHGVV